MNGLGGDQTLTPEYPGISDAADMTSWDPPFPVDLKRVRPKDEDYWDRYRAAPKAIITLADGQRLWGSRYGKVSSLRLSGSAADRSRRRSIPAAAGFSARHVRSEAAAAAQGTTDFGEYFLYFSFFLVVSALLLAYLFFAVGLEQRTTEIGLLSAVGFSPGAIRRSFLAEGAVLAGIGAVIGAVAAVGYGAAIMYGLRTWWVGAVGTTELTLHVAPEWLAIGVGGALAGRDPRHLARGSRHDAAIGAIAVERRHRHADRASPQRQRNSSPAADPGRRRPCLPPPRSAPSMPPRASLAPAARGSSAGYARRRFCFAGDAPRPRWAAACRRCSAWDFATRRSAPRDRC